MRSHLVLIWIAIFAMAKLCFGQEQQMLTPAPGNPTQKMGFKSTAGTMVPQDVEFTNYDGKTVNFKQICSSGRPIIVLPQFYECMGTCLMERESLVKVITKLHSTKLLGKDFDVVIFGIKPTEGPNLAKIEAERVLEIYNKPDWLKAGERNISSEEKERRLKEEADAAEAAIAGLYLTTAKSIEDVRAITNALGFIFYYDPSTGVINHPAGAMVLTPSGRVSGTIFGTDFPTKIVLEQLESASKEQIAKQEQIVLLGCISVDPKTGRKTLIVKNVVNLACVLTLVGLVGWVLSMNRTAKKTEEQNGGPQA